MTRPLSEEIRAARQSAGLTQTKAAALIHATCRAWQKWEAGDAKMNLASWELFNIKIGRSKNHE
ncbi:MAG: transcriptional regulator [Polynucleobacter sp. 39-45-136]|nr:MAG: transcriptional regulator [Polynucleobacter sp. 39-45-136]